MDSIPLTNIELILSKILQTGELIKYLSTQFQRHYQLWMSSHKLQFPRGSVVIKLVPIVCMAFCDLSKVCRVLTQFSHWQNC